MDLMGSAPLLLHPSLLCLTGDVSEAGEELGAFPSLIPQMGLCWGQSCPLCPIVLAIALQDVLPQSLVLEGPVCLLLPPPWAVLLLQPPVQVLTPVLHQHLQTMQHWRCSENLTCSYAAATTEGMLTVHSSKVPQWHPHCWHISAGPSSPLFFYLPPCSLVSDLEKPKKLQKMQEKGSEGKLPTKLVTKLISSS